MPTFRYKTIDTSGATDEGTISAASRTELSKSFKRDGKTLLIAEEVSEGRFGGGIARITFLNTISLKERINLARNLAAMVSAGFAISRGLAVLGKQTKNKKLKEVLEGLNRSIESGDPLSEGLKQYADIFSPLFISMVRAGEESGKLADSLNVVAVQMEQSYQLRKKIRGAMMYPAIVITAMIIIGILMLMFVVPTLTDTFRELNVELPISTKIIIGTSTFLKERTVVALGSLAAAAVLILYSFRTRRGRRAFEWLTLRIPIVGGLIRETNAARTARTLASLLVAGVEVVQAIGITRDVVQNSYFKEVLQESEKRIQEGKQISEVFERNSDLYPVLVAEMVAVGEETGKLPHMLQEVAEFYESEVDRKTKDMSTIIEPFLMIIIGAGVGFFALSMISPIYSLSSGI